jgi:type II secretory ATPase GspE/PulE/Tfp pilus assembly ATPase PilB-like protein
VKSGQLIFCGVLALVAFESTARAQQPAPQNGPPQPAAAATAEAAPPTASPAGQYPRSPTGFVRGNQEMSGQTSSGGYISLMGLVPILGLFLLWVHTTQWVDEDGRALKLNYEFWNSLVFLIGALGFVVVLAFPIFLLGFFTLLAAYGVPLGLYIKERNERVPESAKVMTPRHIQGLVVRYLAMIGIHISLGKDGRDSALGPPIRFIGKSDGKGDDGGRSKQAEKSRGFVACKELIYDAIMRRSTDVHMEPKEEEYAARYRIDGVMYPTEPFDRAMGESIINIFKVLGAMDITEKRKPQDGSFRAQLEKRMIDFRAATQGTREGEKLSLRILDQANAVSRLDQLSMRKQMQDQLKEIINQPHGLFLSCGPTGAGKSTTLYAVLNELDAFQQNIITVEDPVEYKIPNVTQIEVNAKAGNTFPNALRSILRQDPDIVMIGEIRDAETAKIACQAANTGHMVFSTVHANDTISALYRVIDLGVEPFLLSSALSAILGQRLVRRLCDDCKEKYAPKPEILKQAGLPADKVDAFYRPPGKSDAPCPTCGGLGYRGRLGVFELLVITERLRDMIRENAPVSAIRAEARKNGMLYMKEEGLRLVVKGMTSIQELQVQVK